MWNLADVSVGDWIKVQIINKKGDRNLDGRILQGNIVAIMPKYSAVELASGWWCHTKDRLLAHRPAEAKEKAGVES